MLIGEPCRCIHFYPSSHEQEEYDGPQRRLSEQVRENEYENCDSSPTFADSKGDFSRSETHEYPGSNIRKKIAEDIDESSRRLRGYKKMSRSIGSPEKAEEQDQERDKCQKNEELKESKTVVKSNEQNIQEPHNNLSQREMLKNHHEKNFIQNDDEPVISAIISKQISGKCGKHREDPSINTVEKIINESLENNLVRKSSANQKLGKNLHFKISFSIFKILLQFMVNI